MKRNACTRDERHCARGGFTLIDLVIGITVLAIGIGVLSVAFANLIDSSVLPGFLNVATQLAEKEFERVSAKRFSQLVDEGPVPFPGNFSNYEYEVRVTSVPSSLAVDPGMARYKNVQVIVRHNTGRAVQLTTLVTNN